MFLNVVVGKPIADPALMLAENQDDWEKVEKNQTLFTEERFLPRILVEAGVVKNVSEVRRNQPKLVYSFETPDLVRIKWGKKIVWILIGE
jgi:hypothetical protein